jgi:hypothetical protein
VGTAIIPRLVDVVDTVEAEYSYSTGVSRHLSFCQVESWGLRMEWPTPDDPLTEGESIWLIPEADLKLTHRRPRNRHARTPPVLTACRVQRGARSWRATDLLLGLAVPENAPPRIVGADEFAAAVADRLLRPGDADLALHSIHRVLGELARWHHDIPPWLSHHHIRTPWPPL